MTAASTPPLTVLEGFKAFLLWVGGALAGVTALLYTCGYLVTRAHLSMLGLFGVVEFSNDYFLQEGSKFLLSAGYDVLRTLLPLAAVFGAIAVVVLVIARLLRNTGAGKWLASLRDRLAASRWWRYALFALLLFALLSHADRYLREYERPLAVANLLYRDPSAQPAVKAGTPAELEAWILAGDTERLKRAFEDLLAGAVIAAVLALAAWRVAAPWRFRAWLVAPFLLALVIYVVTLPMAYGALQRPVRYAVVTFSSDTPVGTGPLFLLAKSAEAFVVWDAAARRVVWVPAGSVKRAEIMGIGALFGPTGGINR